MTAPSTMTTESRRLFTGLPGFAAATIALTGLSGWAMTLGFHGVGDSQAIRVSAVVAAAVQIGAFPVVRVLTTKNAMLGWGAGSLFRFLSLIAYAVVAGTIFHLPLPAALISLLVFYFLSMVIEPLFLRS